MQELRGFNTGGTAEKRLRPEIQSLYFGIFLRDKQNKTGVKHFPNGKEQAYENDRKQVQDKNHRRDQ